MKENGAIPQQIGQLKMTLLFQTCQMGNCYCLYTESLFISFELIFFFTDIQTQTCLWYLLEVERQQEDISSTFPLVQVARSNVLFCELFSTVFWIMLTSRDLDSHRRGQWLLRSSCFFCLLILFMLSLFILLFLLSFSFYFSSHFTCFVFLFVSLYIY